MGFLLTITIIVALSYLVGFVIGLLLGVAWVLVKEGIKWML